MHKSTTWSLVLVFSVLVLPVQAEKKQKKNNADPEVERLE